MIYINTYGRTEVAWKACCQVKKCKFLLAFCYVSYAVFFQMKSLLNSPGFGITGSSGWKNTWRVATATFKRIYLNFAGHFLCILSWDSTMTWENTYKRGGRQKTKLSLFDLIKKHHSFVGAEAVFGPDWGRVSSHPFLADRLSLILQITPLRQSYH